MDEVLWGTCYLLAICEDWSETDFYAVLIIELFFNINIYLLTAWIQKPFKDWMGGCCSGYRIWGRRLKWTFISYFLFFPSHSRVISNCRISRGSLLRMYGDIRNIFSIHFLECWLTWDFANVRYESLSRFAHSTLPVCNNDKWDVDLYCNWRLTRNS